ncbi:MAG: hypothetical protein ABJC89_25160 [Acidobacteriota bacterium]
MTCIRPAPRAVFVPIVLSAIISGAHPAIAVASPLIDSQRTVRSEKESRTPAQRKIDSQLLYELYRFRGEAKQKNVPPDPTGVRVDRTNRALVDVRAEVTAALQKKVRSLGGAVQSTSTQYRSIIAWVPLRTLERLAEDPAVRAIVPAAEPAIK